MEKVIVDFVKKHTLKELSKNDKVLIREFLRTFNDIDSYSMTYTQPEFILEVIRGKDVSTLHVDSSVTKKEDIDNKRIISYN